VNQITRYLLRQLTITMLAVTVCLTFVVWLTQSLRFVDLIVNQGLDIGRFLSLVMLLMPRFLVIVLPIATFAAILFIYGKAALDSEMVALRAAGVSPVALGRPALLLALFVMAVMYFINVYGLPAAYRHFKDLQFEIRNDFTAILFKEGVFNTITDGVVIYVRARNPDGELFGIFINDQRDPALSVTITAERAVIAESDEGPRAVLINGTRQERTPGAGGGVATLSFDQYTMPLEMIAPPSESRYREPAERYLHELFSPTDGEYDDQARLRFLAEAHWRLAGPLHALMLSVIAIAVMLSGDFNRRGLAKRIGLAVALAGAAEALTFAVLSLAQRFAAFAPLIYILAIAPAPVVALAMGWPRRLGLRRLRPSMVG
jgi:lipopolysaccharide export system permease protein